MGMCKVAEVKQVKHLHASKVKQGKHLHASK